MSELDAIDDRLRAVERALTGSDDALTDLESSAELTDRTDDLARRVDELEERLDELDAATQALRGYVGNVRAVNEDVAERADAALAAVERLDEQRDDATTTARLARRPSPRRPTATAPAEPSDSDSGTTGLLDRVRRVL